MPGSLKGKTIIITGANSGVGFDSALACAQRGAAVIMGCRSLERGNAAAEEIKAQLFGADSGSLTVMQLDVSSIFESTSSAAPRERGRLQRHDWCSRQEHMRHPSSSVGERVPSVGLTSSSNG